VRRVLAPACLLAAAAAHAPGLTPAQIAEKTSPAVVFITADTAAGESVGSGFIVDPLGTVVTSLHVVEGATAIRVKLASGLAYDHVRVRAVDDRADLAILQLAGFGLPSVALGDSGSLGVLSFKVKGSRRRRFAIPIEYARRLISSEAAPPE
jgi:putative serine protease PepD